MSFFKETKDQGLLGFFGLHDWFRGLSKKEQSAIRKIYEETSGQDASDLDSVEIETSETAQGFLGSIAIGLIAQKEGWRSPDCLRCKYDLASAVK